MKSIFLLLLVALTFHSFESLASHIVGGEITYRHLNGNEYRIKMSLYVDCLHGNPIAILQDEVVTISVYNDQKQLLDTFHIHRTGPVHLKDTKYNCILPSTDICVDIYTYEKMVTLPASSSGLILVFQRCCRNHIISNMVQSENIGASFWTRIPPIHEVGPNSSPVFDSLPPNFLCNSKKLLFSHTATDPDGDSLVYELCTPFDGGSPSNPIPQPAAPPPYPLITWKSPFSEKNMIPGNISIDAQSGQLQVLPIKDGQYVVGICVKEYRKGKLIGVTRRDYQFNVLQCNIRSKASFIAPPEYCEQSLKFLNHSNGDKFHWDFGVPNTASDTSSSKEPEFTFPYPDDYKVKLIAYSGKCKDSTSKTIKIRDRASQYFAGPDTVLCLGDSVQLGYQEPYSGYRFKWEPGRELSSESISNPIAFPATTSTIKVSKTYQSCTFRDSVIIQVKNPIARFNSKIIKGCFETQVITLNKSEGAENYSWLVNGEEVSKKSEPVFTFNKKKTLTISLLARAGTCIDTQSRHFVVDPGEEAEIVIPNVITPNGDGKNDCFECVISGASNQCRVDNIQIYNRWGKLVYKGSDCWDATYKGTPLSEGSYFYMITIGEKKYKGAVMVIR